MRGMRSNLFVTALLFVLVLQPGRVGSEQVLSSWETQQCLECHAKPGLGITFQNKETLSASVDPDKFKRSVHGSLACSACHGDFASGKHPTRMFKSKAQYQIKSSLVCRRCHTSEQIKKCPVHVELLKEEQRGKALVCANCHGSHAIARISGKGALASEEQYCMKCHSRQTILRFKNGGSRPMKVDLITLKTSVHGKLDCSDCHFGFSSDEHPQRNFRTARDFTLASSESCRRCHFDKYTKTLEGIHYAILSQGQMNAPVCIDCHGSHEIARVGRERTASAKRCQRCHSKEYDDYAKSVHGSALFNEHNQDVPVCADCHTAHTIQDPFSLDYRERIPEMCSNCHANKEIVGKYGLSTDVVKTYLSDFHGVTLGLYKIQRGENYKPGKPIAVCTDCHGNHNITTTIGPDSTIVKKNLLKRCQKCHRDANEHFPDTWLSHYGPSLTRAPLVFIAGIVFKIFIPIMIIGLVFQILLHIWRYAINR
jgi:predicted CXXCH cytochrome family protein